MSRRMRGHVERHSWSKALTHHAHLSPTTPLPLPLVTLLLPDVSLPPSLSPPPGLQAAEDSPSYYEAFANGEGVDANTAYQDPTGYQGTGDDGHIPISTDL